MFCSIKLKDISLLLKLSILKILILDILCEKEQKHNIIIAIENNFLIFSSP